EAERRPAPPPLVADPLLRIEDHLIAAATLEVVPGREPDVAAADDHRLDMLILSRHLRLLLLVARRRVREPRLADIGWIHQLARAGAWSFLTTTGWRFTGARARRRTPSQRCGTRCPAWRRCSAGG